MNKNVKKNSGFKNSAALFYSFISDVNIKTKNTDKDISKEKKISIQFLMNSEER